jgi:hypothetical protein
VQFRCDSAGSLGALRDTPGGGKVAPAVFARVGVLTYHTPEGVVREYTPPEVLKAAADALSNAPVTNLHPPKSATPQGALVTPDNAQTYRHGHVAGAVQFDGTKMHGEVALDTKEILAAAARGRVQVSLGYLRAVEFTPGLTPEGEPYDAIRTRIVPNHVALVDTGRAGRSVCLKLDSIGNQIPDTEESATTSPEDSMTLEQLQAENAALKAQLKVKTDAADAVATLQPKLTATEAKLDAANAEVTKLTAEVAALKDPTKLDAAVTARLDLIGKARKVVGDGFKADGKTEEQIQLEVAQHYAKARPSIKLDGKGADYVRAMFEVACDAVEADPEGHKAMAATLAPVKNPAPGRATTDAAPTPAWRKPLAANKA